MVIIGILTNITTYEASVQLNSPNFLASRVFVRHKPWVTREVNVTWKKGLGENIHIIPTPNHRCRDEVIYMHSPSKLAIPVTC